jgi:hypothetical protein
MWWRWWRRRPRCASQSEQAKAEARQELDEVMARWPAVKARAESLRRGRERNHFGEAMLELFRGGQP